eukprot:TRINITY_DN4307_c0_g2_i1.p1 TRINITY_DN4307_c0_g2~~TRINITY_DN4307_c0_g2_i1.p1  ORF type:complete len:362 (-),score=144.39 TRINITY_DN4307_c0_g2_i1:439-1485(-)
MKVTVIAVALALLLGVASASISFPDYVAKYNKPYAKKAFELLRRSRIFAANMKTINEQRKALQAQGIAPWQGVNEFTDMTRAEFLNSGRVMKKKFVAGQDATSCLAHGVTSETLGKLRAQDIPTSFDWRTKGVVSPVQNQGGCGSCWAFSTAAVLESAWAVKTGNLTKLSEQEIVDCSTACISEDNQQVCNQGCNGGWPWAALDDIVSWGGLMTESEYPYTGMDGTCGRKQSQTIEPPKNYTCLSGPNYANETDMASFLYANGPLSISMDAGLLQFYFGGIIHPRLGDCSKTHLDHAILIVGYGVSGTDEYWIVRNSWGEDWGEKGYFRIVRGKGACGLNAGVVFPVL